MKQFDVSELVWTGKPKEYTINDDRIEIITNPHTDLWQRTYYHFRNDNLIKNMDENAEVREVKYFDNVVQSVDDIKDMLYNHFKTMPLYRRKKKIKRIIFSKLTNNVLWSQ